MDFRRSRGAVGTPAISMEHLEAGSRADAALRSQSQIDCTGLCGVAAELPNDIPTTCSFAKRRADRRCCARWLFAYGRCEQRYLSSTCVSLALSPTTKASLVMGPSVSRESNRYDFEF